MIFLFCFYYTISNPLQGYMFSLSATICRVNYIFLKYWTSQRTNRIYLNNFYGEKRALHLLKFMFTFVVACFFCFCFHFLYVFCIFKLSLCEPHIFCVFFVYVICINLCNLRKFYARNLNKQKNCDFCSHLN